MHWPLVLCCSLALAGFSGCDKPGTPVASGFEPGEPTQAQGTLQTMKLWLGSAELKAELALTPIQQQTGMMYRTNLAENSGMLFPLAYTQQASFWMKHCPYPLSIAYIDTEGVIREIHDLRPHDTNSVVSAAANIRFTLETNQGWFQRHNVREGMTIRTERGSLMDTFFPKK
jgi:uncharacterized membrane protein (UPF0127 family)